MRFVGSVKICTSAHGGQNRSLSENIPYHIPLFKTRATTAKINNTKHQWGLYNDQNTDPLYKKKPNDDQIFIIEKIMIF